MRPRPPGRAREGPGEELTGAWSCHRRHRAQGLGQGVSGGTRAAAALGSLEVRTGTLSEEL